MTTTDFILLFIVPLVAMVGCMFAMRAILGVPEEAVGGTGWDDMHREAYVGVLVAAVVAVVVELIRGGPEPFVLIWNPLLTTVMILPVAYAIALIVHVNFGKKPEVRN